MRLAVLWSGGKDSSLACQKVILQGNDVVVLVTFILDDWPSLCHPLSIMSLQSQALGIPHMTFKVAEPHKQAYRQAISSLIRTKRIQGITSGGIWLEGHRRWVENICAGSGTKVIMPLWNENTEDILDALVSHGYRPIFTCVKEPWFDADWLGRPLDERQVLALKSLRQKSGIDICGENGEYHTMVLDGPTFKQSIQIHEFSKEKQNSMLFLKVNRCSLQPKIPRSS